MTTSVIFARTAITPADEIRDAAIVIGGGSIASVGSRAGFVLPQGAAVYDAGSATIIPGFVDLHIHGAGGRDVMEASVEALNAIAVALARHGTTSFVATTVTASPEALCRSAAGIAAYMNRLRSEAPLGGLMAQVHGIHFEGPFISKARRGVHPEEWIAAPSLPLLANLLNAAGGAARIITLAPELPGALELIDAARAAGLLVSLGHTDATYEQSVAAIGRGARHAAHVFNAMRPFSHRDTGVIGAVLTWPEVTAELIADGVHVDGSAIRILLAAKGATGISLVSDGTSATGMPDGAYRLGEIDVDVRGGVVRNKEGKLAGSALTLDQALRNIVALGVPLPDAVRMLTLNPARELGIEMQKGALVVGADADLILLDAELRISKVMIGGSWLS
jgi:N-acetylglucosamine-6-phosphate deacetylase